MRSIASGLPASSVTFTVCMFLMFHAAIAITRLRRKSAGSGELRGSFLDTDPSNSDDGLPRIVEISARLMKDVLLWDELKEDGVTIKQCARNTASGRARITFRRSGLDLSDLQVGSSFVISVKDWKAQCSLVLPRAGIDENDDVLFYTIKKVKKRRNVGILIMEITSGKDVIPSVRFNIRTATEADQEGRTRKIEFYDDDNSVRDMALQRNGHKNISLPVLSRPSVSFSESVEIFPAVTLSVESSLDVSISNFELVRASSITVKWEQEINAMAGVELSVNEDVPTQEVSGELFKQFIPGFGLGIDLPLVGSFGFGATVTVDWIAEFGADTTVTASYDASYNLRQQVEAEVGNARITSVESLLSDPNSATGSFNFGEELSFSIGIDGFIGLRPSISVEASIGSNSVSVDVGAKVGLQADVDVMFPTPFQPVSSSRPLGMCDKCHHVRGAVNFVGTDLEAASQVLVSSLFEVNVGTLCAVVVACP